MIFSYSKSNVKVFLSNKKCYIGTPRNFKLTSTQYFYKKSDNETEEEWF